ncbi:MAG TPA: hypothetical protein VJR47_09995 [Stellaceae bacterium]|nr:hypothetical protein [Stellaceae bacterium]
MRSAPLMVSVEILDHPNAPTTVTLIGRDAWAFLELRRAGEAGCTPIDHPGPRWSGYVLKLRRAGLRVETIHESHGGAFPGRHARYVLRSLVRIIEQTSPQTKAA